MLGCLFSNFWILDDDVYWVMNVFMVVVFMKFCVERWGFSFWEFLEDFVGWVYFMDFLGKEFSGENFSFWEVCEEFCYGV